MQSYRFAGLWLFLGLSGLANAQLTIHGFNGLTAALSTNGTYVVSAGNSLQLSGTAATRISNSRIASGADNLGEYQELVFDYAAGTASREASIRAYGKRPLVLFALTYLNSSANTAPFPVLDPLPAALHHLSYNGTFSYPSFTDLLPDSPWVYFDDSGNTLIISPASDYMVAATTSGTGGQIQAGISTRIATLPGGMTHRTALAYGPAIGQTFTAWGKALTDITGKQRPANDADTLLNAISYWTDNGAAYYYNPGGASYTDTLRAVKAEFDAKAIKLGSMQLDSWWYPKGPDDAWPSHGGIWAYIASPAIFQPDLATFQSSLGVPLATHSRWIDAASPYRGQYTISGNVATDPRYWEDIASYLKASGVVTYEQDWLDANAQTNFNLTDPTAFLDNMAASMAARGITLQYCMGTPKHFLQSTNYGNLTTIRVSQDAFGPTRWTQFLYSSQLAAALGIWPFSDVLMSSDRDSLILATLSAGPVGLGDALGGLSQANLLKAVRGDGVIVKPDVPIMPLDSVFASDAQGIDTPMVASTYSDFGALRATYIFAYVRAANAPITVQPSAYGIAGASFLYDYFSGAGYLIAANQSITVNLNGGTGYFVLAAVGKTGVAFLGDKGQFATMGKKRIATFTDTGRIDVTVSYAAGEKVRTLFGYSAQPVTAVGVVGSVEKPIWDPSTQLFTVRVHAPNSGAAHARIVQSFNELPVTTDGGDCGIRCGSAHPAPIGVKNPVGGGTQQQ
jgi:hypothetical protein